jgi:quercetin dioxygenase-like cupin family protein
MELSEMAAPYALADGEGEATWFLSNRMTVKATAESTNGGFGLVESWIPAGHSPPLHIHRREDESFWVLEGRIRFRVGEDELVAEAGSFVFGPRDVPHTFVVEEGPAHVLTLLTPGGGERFFVDAGREPEGPGLPPPGPPDVEKLRQVAQQYEAEIIGPPLSPEVS